MCYRNMNIIGGGELYLHWHKCNANRQGYDFRGHTRGTLVVGIAYGCPYYKGSAIFSLVFLSTTSEKSFIPYKASATAQALKVCPFRPRVLSSWGIPSTKE